MNRSLASCSLSELVVLLVTLPMNKTAFLANQDAYVVSIAATAEVVKDCVEVLSINEFSTRSSREIARHLPSALSVNVQTSVLIAIEQEASIEDQSLLNDYLNINGLPSCSLVVEYINSTGSTVSFRTVLGPQGIGGIVGMFAALLFGVLLARMLRQKYREKDMWLKTMVRSWNLKCSYYNEEFCSQLSKARVQIGDWLLELINMISIELVTRFQLHLQPSFYGLLF